MLIIPVILCGGSGSRLWPLSREHHPKQFLSLINDTSLLQDTVKRAAAVSDAKPIVVCGENHRFMVAQHLKEINIDASILLEPEAKNTAPAIALAANFAKQAYKDQEPVLFVMPADHHLQFTDAFLAQVKSAFLAAEQGALVTFGVKPSYPATSYGYIKAGEALQKDVLSVQQFVEKPELKIAEQYFESGEYYWNAGLFMLSASQYLTELNLLAPKIYSTTKRACEHFTQDVDFIRVNKTAFAESPSEAIDTAIMEKTDKAAVVPIDILWHDIGSWASLQAVLDADENGNTIQGDVIAENSKDNYIRSESRLVVALGVHDLIISETADAILIADKNKSEDVKLIVNQLKASERAEVKNHRKVCRPWGSFEAVDDADGFLVKRITLNPGASISMQQHKYRSEHWIVVEGEAEVVCGEKNFLLRQNQSTYIPKNSMHQLKNIGQSDLKMIEVQVGDYLGEDDILRFETEVVAE